MVDGSELLGSPPLAALPAWLVPVVLVGCLVLVVAVSAVIGHRQNARVRAVEAAAPEAAEYDAAFAADRIHADAGQLYRDAWKAWEARDRDRLNALMTPEVAAEFGRGMERKDVHAFLASPVRVRYVSLINRGNERDDRVTVIVAAKVVGRQEVPGAKDRKIRFEPKPYWTLAKRDGRWIVAKMETHNPGKHHLTEPMVTKPDGA
jgi:predicted lipid-binding transport protein (Tim44 family)